jgi:hypothetical protein
MILNCIDEPIGRTVPVLHDVVINQIRRNEFEREPKWGVDTKWASLVAARLIDSLPIQSKKALHNIRSHKPTVKE